jgi:hypothetical protein
MDRPKIKNKHGKEFGIQSEVIRFLKDHSWHVERLVGGEVRGGAIQSGLPDLFACHAKWGLRFIEIKYEDSYRFTAAQKWKFPLLMANGCGIWILTEASEEQYDRLFKEPNLWDYLKQKDCHNIQELDEILSELTDDTKT